MTDMASHGAPQPDNGELRHTLSIEEVGLALGAAGVPRSHRQIIRYCETGLLEAVKMPGPTGAQWFVSPASLPKAIGDLREWQAQRDRQRPTKPDMSSSVQVDSTNRLVPDMASHGAPQLAMSSSDEREQGSKTELAMSKYVEQLECRIEEKNDVIDLLKGQLVAKDEQIGELSTRYRETHSLLGAMQRMFAPLLGQADPYTQRDVREDGSRVDNREQSV